MKNRYRAGLLAISCLGWALPNAALAQSESASSGRQDATAESTADQEGDPRGVLDIVVTARKISESQQTVPLSITAISGADLEAQSVKSVFDVQRQVPNLVLLTIAAEPQALTLSLRGQRQNDIVMTADPSVGIYIDGLYYPRTFGLRNALVDVSRTEVLRGPQGTLYGRNTTGGALSLYSNDPTPEFGGSVYGSYGNYNAFELVGVVNVPLSGTVSARLVAQHNEHDGYGFDGLGRELADEKNTYLRGKVKADFNSVSVLLFGSYQRGSNGGAIIQIASVNPRNNPPGATSTLTQITRERGLAVTPANLVSSSMILQSYVGGDPYRNSATSPSYSRFEGYTVGLDVNFEINDLVSLRSITGYEHLDRANRTDLDATPYTIIDVTRLTTGHYAGQELQILGNSSKFNWVVGAFVSSEAGTETSPNLSLPLVSATTPATNIGEVENSSYAAFAQGTYDLGQFRLTAGGRYSLDDRSLVASNRNLAGCVVPAPGVIVRVITGSAQTQCPREFHVSFDGASWLASLDWRPSDAVLLYGKIARGYRTGGINLRGANTIESFSVFRPEEVTEYEVGFKGSLLDKRLRINLAGFYDDYTNIQRSTSRLTANGIQPLLLNAASGRIYGFEAELSARPTGRLSVTATAGLTATKYFIFNDDVLGDRSNETFGVPRWTGSASARYVLPLPNGDVALQLDYSYRSSNILVPEAVNIGPITQPAYGLWNGRINWEIKSINTEIAIFGRNLTNEVVYDSAGNLENSLGYNYKIVGEPRTYGLSAKFRF